MYAKDKILIDIPKRKIELKISKAEYDRRMKVFRPRRKKLRGYLKRYSEAVTSADKGAVFVYNA